MSNILLRCSILFALVAVHLANGETNNNNNSGRFDFRRSQSDPRLNRNFSNFNRQPPSRRHKSCENKYDFDYTQLTLMWAPGECSTSPQECKREEKRHFTVHGMWPTIRGTQEPEFCCFDNSFDYSAIESLLPELNEWWFSYFDLTGNKRFWSHEWLKHGTCSRDIKNLKGELNYFSSTLKLAKSLPVMETLKAANIVPDNVKVYRSVDFSNALKKLSNGKNVSIDCDYEHHQPIPIVTGVNFCFDKNLAPSDCPESKRKCQRQLKFPSSSTRI